MNTPSIKANKLSKRYKLGMIGRHTLVDELQFMWYKLRGHDPRQHMAKIGQHTTAGRGEGKGAGGNDHFWALKDVSFDIKSGEVVGVIGKNGAGKSTLLKILTRITEPTSGEAWIHGRVASLLEVGTGFHPELTGRENVYMNGTILGMKKKEIMSRFDEIVEFSEISKFIDTPVKRYSSGMYVRLAFGVAAHLDPEILLVDEVLAVGDASFQKKCLGKMKDVSRQGRTVFLVSHNMNSIRALCPRCLWIADGRLKADGQSKDVIDLYLQEKGEKEPAKIFPVRSACEEIQLDGVTKESHPADLILRVALQTRSAIKTLGVGIEIKSLNGDVVLSQGALHSGAFLHDVNGLKNIRVTVPGILGILTGGTYSVRLWLSAPGIEKYVDAHNVADFDLPGPDPTRSGHDLNVNRNGPVYCPVLIG